MNKYDSELYYARRSPSRAVTRVGIAAAATREPISMVISRRPIIEYAKYVYARWRAASTPLSLPYAHPLPLPLPLSVAIETCQSISDVACLSMLVAEAPGTMLCRGPMGLTQTAVAF